MRIKKLISIFLALSLSLTLFAKNSVEDQNNVDSGSTTIKEKKLDDIKGDRGQYDGLPIVEGRVHRAGMLRLNMPNAGYLGNPDGIVDPCTNQAAPNAEMPAGSSVDFLFQSAVWFGGYLDSSRATVTSDSVEAIVFQGPLVSTGKEGWSGRMWELWPVNVSAEFGVLANSNIIEKSNVKGRQNCLFEDVYDPTATAEEQFDVMYSDKYVNPGAGGIFTGSDPTSGRNHIPLGIEVKRKSYAWSYEYAQKFVIIDYTLYNRSESSDGSPRDIYNFFMGDYFDMDIGDNDQNGGDIHGDDLGGFFEIWDDYIDPATLDQKPQVLNLAWAADNDSRPYQGQAGNTGASIVEDDGPLGLANGIVTVRVLRNPNPNLEFSFNNYTAETSANAEANWGPRWKDNYHGTDPNAVFWNYDLMPKQRGYDDGNQGYNINPVPGAGGITEGCALTDIGRYMVMSNSEFDYDQTKINDINFSNPNPAIADNLIGDAIEYVEPPRLNPNHIQNDKWKQWDVTSDGSVDVLNNIQNGRDTKMILSFGPLGRESNVKVAVDEDQNGTIDSYINKDVHVFEHGDSLKLTIAFIVNENFHTDQTQDPREGIIEEKFTQGWYDALYNVVWAERVYDIPMFDSPVDFAGLLKGDGWYGEDVGSDGIYAEENGEICWWTNTVYNGRDEDGTEQNNELDTLNTGLVDIYGSDMFSEDEFLQYGNTSVVTEDIGLTSNYGYRIKDSNGNWVRYGFGNNMINQGDGIPDFTGPPPPPSPVITTSYNNTDITTEWFSHEFFVSEEDTIITGPENTRDKFSKVVDFEGYQVLLSPDEQAQNYVEIFAVDRVNYGYENAEHTGDFLDHPFDNADTTLTIYDEGTIWNRTEFGDNNSIYDSYETNQYSYSAEQQGTVMNEEGEEVPFWNYKFTLKDRQYAKVNYLAVTASDFGDPKTGTPSLRSSPTINGISITPTKVSGDDKVYVVPNPYRADIDYSNSWELTTGTWFEDDRKIVFLNIPEKSVIKIYTLAGDLVKTLGHNNKARASEKYAENGESWNLINDNEQAVTSGIYLFNVKDLNDDSYDFVGKFVIIK